MFDEIHGEYTCNDCGLILLDKIFDDRPKGMVEQTSYRFVSKGLGTDTSIHKMTSSERKVQVGIDYCTMICSEMELGKQTREQIYYLYRHLRDVLFRTRQWSYEERASALTFYVLRDSHIPCSVEDVSRHLEANTKRVSKCAKQVAKALGKPHVLSQTNYGGLVQRYAQELGLRKYWAVPEVFNYVSKCAELYGLPINPTLVAISITLYNKIEKTGIKQGDVSTTCNISVKTIVKWRKKLLTLMGTEMRALEFVTVEQFVNGVYE
tara:strand:+ start:1247 stop:2041 length:795 start_codon:yes stop_codon:yes gene_type:complete